MAAVVARRVGLVSWLKLVRTGADVADGFECLAEKIGEGVRGGNGLPPGLDLDYAVAAGDLDELPDERARLRLDRAVRRRARRTRS